MNTQQFYDKAVLIVKDKTGSENPGVTTVSGCYNGNILHSCLYWDGMHHIRSRQLGDPMEALKSFEDAITFHLKKYEDEQKVNVEL